MAPPVRRRIRPVQVIPFEDLEDQLWPVNLLVVVLAGFVVGLILGLSRFDDPRLFYNAYFQLLTVGLTLGLWFVAVRWVRGRLKQRLKIAALFSLVAHLWLLLSLGVGYYRLILEAKTSQDKLKEIAELRIPDYPEEAMEQGEFATEYHRPVETLLPAPQTPAPPKQPLETSLPRAEKPAAPMPKPPVPEPAPPLPVERRELAPPHRAESVAEPIRRQITELRQEPLRPEPLPKIQPAAPPKGPEASTELVERQPSQTPRPERPPLVPLAVERPAPGAAATTRRQLQTPEKAPELEAGGPNRPVRPAPEVRVPQLAAPPPQAASTSEQPVSVYQPRAVAFPRAASKPVDRKQPVSVPPASPEAPARAAVVARNWEHPIPMAEQSEKPLARQLRQAVPAPAIQEAPPQMAAAPSRALPIGPAPTPLARQQPSTGHLAERSPASEVQAPVAAPPGQVAVARVHRPEDSARAGWQLQAGPAEQTAARTTQTPRFEGRAEQVRLPAETSSAPGPSTLQTGRADAVSVQPARQSKALPGHRPAQAPAGTVAPVTGAGLPQLAAAARPVQASQQGEEGLLEPTQKVGLLPVRQPGTPAPSATLPHEEASLAGAVGPAQSSGGDQLSQWEAGSQTSLSRQAPGAPLGDGGRGSPAVSPVLAAGPPGAIAPRTMPSEGGMISLPLAQRPELGRSRSGDTQLAGLDGRAAETIPGPAPSSGWGPGTGQTESGPPVGAVQPGNVPVGRTQEGPSLPTTRAGGEGSWQVPVGTGGVALGSPRRAGVVSETTIHGDQEKGGIGLARQMGRLPSQDLAATIPEVPASSAQGAGFTKGLTPSGGSGPSGVEPELPGGGGQRGVTLGGLPNGRPGGIGQLGSLMPGETALAGGPPQGVAIGTGIGKGRAKGTEEAGLENALAAMPLPRAVRSELPGTALEPIPGPGGTGDQPGTKAEGPPRGGTAPGAGQGSSGQAMGGSLGGEMVALGRQAGGLPVYAPERPGVGGVSQVPSLALGVPIRRARPESQEVHLSLGRFLLERSGSRPAIDARAEPAEAFRQRHPSRRAQQAQQYGGSEASEQAVERGLAFLAKLQWPDGRWRFHAIPKQLETWSGQAQALQQPDLLIQMAKKLLEESDRWKQAPEIHQRYQNLQQLLQRHSQGGLDAGGLAELAELVREAVFFPGVKEADSAATGLALLAFLGAGYTHQEGPYRAQVQRGLQWLLANQKPDGDLWGYSRGSENTWLYSHGIAAIALCEAYGMTKEPGLREPAERAIGFIVASQNPTRGGWRYQPREDSDTSVSGWMLMALKSAQMAGLEVPQKSLDLVSRWLDLAKATDGDGSRYVYNPFSQETAPEFWFHRAPTASMTAEALLMRMYLGWNRDHVLLQRGADFLLANPPEPGSPNGAPRDAYYWYYATQVMFQMAGQHWDSWNGKLRPYLESSQVQEGPLAGSWEPARPAPDRFAYAGGRLYVTAMHLLMLEVYYRHLPLFKTLREEPNTSPQ